MQDEPPAGTRAPVVPSGRPLQGVLVVIGLSVLAGIALWVAFTGIGGPAEVDPGALREAVLARTPVLTTVAIAITTVGSTAAMAALAIALGAWCLYHGRIADAALAVGAMSGGALLFRGLKLTLDRPRPPPVSRLVHVTNESLPSGHATMAVVVIGTLVVLSWEGHGVVGRVVSVLAAAAWIGAVGATRVYLGVHWLSDVVAGWAVGAAWLALCVAVWLWWRRRVSEPT